jgi:tetratricopeptide (TPR) repeat protein
MPKIILQLEQHNKVIVKCDDVLALEPNSVKALFRKAQSLFALKDTEGALCWISRAAELAPEDGGVKNLLAKAKGQPLLINFIYFFVIIKIVLVTSQFYFFCHVETKRKEEQHQKAVYQKMFG